MSTVREAQTQISKRNKKLLGTMCFTLVAHFLNEAVSGSRSLSLALGKTGRPVLGPGEEDYGQAAGGKNPQSLLRAVCCTPSMLDVWRLLSFMFRSERHV